jgi:N utilization substance protein B
MANRHLSRSVVLQTLFEWDFNHKSLPSITTTLANNATEFADDAGDREYMDVLLSGVLQNLEAINQVIEKAAPDWPLEKIATVDRNILRIGLYELLFGDHDEAPPKVAINEAIELGKGFGGDASGRFINGVLGSVYRELGEPGKDQASNKIKNIPYSKMPVQTLVGSLIYANDDGMIKVALIHDVFGRWTLPKGHIEDGESDFTAIKRISSNELGITVNPGEELGGNEYIANDPEAGKVRKQVRYYLSETELADLTPGESDGIQDAKWFSLPEVVTLRFYKDVLPIVTKGAEIILKNEED